MNGPVVAFADFERSTFAILNREGTSYRVRDGLVKPNGLTCFTCKGGRYTGSCWAVNSVRHSIDSHASETVPDPSLGAGASVEAYRG